MRKAAAEVTLNWWSILRPPPKQNVAEWADKEMRLSAEASAEPGRFRVSRAMYQAEMMAAASDPNIHTIVAMTSAQVGKTTILLAFIGFHIDQDPSPILVLQPTLDMGQAFSKDRLAPLLRDTPALAGKVKDPRSRDSGNTLLHKGFPGGHITIAGANSAASLASRPAPTARPRAALRRATPWRAGRCGCHGANPVVLGPSSGPGPTCGDRFRRRGT